MQELHLTSRPPTASYSLVLPMMVLLQKGLIYACMPKVKANPLGFKRMPLAISLTDRTVTMA